jgi:hypothetical protein
MKRSVIRIALLVTTLFLTLSARAAAQQRQPLPSDPLPALQIAVAVGSEVGRLCKERFPDLAPKIDEAFKSWPLNGVSVQILVNGKEYISQFIEALIAQIREDFTREEISESRKGCAAIETTLAALTRKVPDPFLKQVVPDARQR